jgi:hypothetical protein
LTSKKIQIVRVADRVVLDAELVTGLRPEDLIDIDRQWLPLRQRVVRGLRDAGVPQENWPESSGWNWVRKSAALKLMAIRGFGIRLEERWIGVSMINVAQFSAKLAPDQNKPLVYLEFIETAPDCWPEKIAGVAPKFAGCGAQMLRQVVFESVEEDFQGRVGLHSLDQSRSFYERHGMTFIEIDATKENLAYYEFTKETAAAFLRSGDKT